LYLSGIFEPRLWVNNPGTSLFFSANKSEKLYIFMGLADKNEGKQVIRVIFCRVLRGQRKGQHPLQFRAAFWVDILLLIRAAFLNSFGY